MLALPTLRSAVLSSSGFDPRSIPGLAAWYDASRHVAADGDPVTTWADLSGNGRHATQATTSRKLTYRAAVQNGLGTLQADGVDDYAIATPLDFSQGFLISLVVRRNAATLGLPVSQWIGSSDARMQLIFAADGGIQIRALQTSLIYIGRSAPAATLAVGTFYVVSVGYSGGQTASSLSIFRNGTQVDTANDTAGTFTGVPASSTKAFEIGAQSNGANPINAHFGEIVVANGSAWVSRRAQLDTSLRSKWGIT